MDTEHITAEGPDGRYQNVFESIKSCDLTENAHNHEWKIEELNQLLAESFKETGQKCLTENGGTIFTTLSGGVDSTLALAILRKTLGPTTEIVSVTMGGSESHPDIQFGKLAAETFKSEHYEYIPNPEEIEAGLREFQQLHPEADLRDDVTKGNFDVFMLYRYLSQKLNAKSVIAHDGIDELMGGYWQHRQKQTDDEKAEQFKHFWDVLIKDHLQPLTSTARAQNINVEFPYLENNLVDYISGIPLDERTDFSVSKKPIRALAELYGVPKSIIERTKRGQIGMMDLS